MPELPEVETCRQGLIPHILHHTISNVIVRNPNLRWPIPAKLKHHLQHQKITAITRRGKYLLFTLSSSATLLLHLGMSGRIRIVPIETPIQKHDHVDIILDNGTCIRFNDSRRFGSLLWTDADPMQHSLLIQLGPEPLEANFNANYLHTILIKRSQAIKLAIMDSHTVVGVGNIYANEALFLSGIHPHRPAKSLTKNECQHLVKNIKKVLQAAIKAGGTTLRDFISVDGKPGYFQQTLLVYGRAGEPCTQCGTVLQESRLGQRSTVFCLTCQPNIEA